MASTRTTRAPQKRQMLRPDSIERSYAKQLMIYAQHINDSTLNYLQERSLLKNDSQDHVDSWFEDLSTLFAYLLSLFLDDGEIIIAKLPDSFNAIGRFNDLQWRLQVKAGTGIDIGSSTATMGDISAIGSPASAIRAKFGMGVDVYRSEPWLRDMQANWVAANTSLIKSIPTQQLQRIEQIVQNGVLQGLSTNAIAKQIKEAASIGTNRARIIARDQVGKANGLLTQERQKDLGIKSYEWITCRDERVRGNPEGRYPGAIPSHYARDTKIFEWAKPPEGGHPGIAIMCRCWASARFDDLGD